MNDAGPSRRVVLAGGGLLAGAFVTASCTSAADPEPAPSTDPDNRVRAQVAASVRGLIEQYDAVLAQHPQLAAELSPLAAEHDAHLAAILPTTSTASPSTSGAPSSPTSTSSAPALPTISAAAARRSLASAERGAAAQRVGQTSSASPELARLVASIGAAEAAHAALLAGGP